MMMDQGKMKTLLQPYLHHRQGLSIVQATEHKTLPILAM